MGGNVKLPTGERAEKINIALMNIDAFNDFKRELRNTFHDFNIMFERTYNYRLWPKYDILFSNQKLFSGSTRLMFKKSFSQFALYKPSVGDIDIQVPNECMTDLKSFLLNNRNMMFGHFKYLGFTNTGMQLNCLFKSPKEYKMFSKYVQIDFEGTEYVNDEPSEFSAFGHYSSWTDVKAGIKGFANKYLLRSLAAGIAKAEVVIISSKTGKPIKSKPMENLFGFSVDKGFREKIKPNYDENGNHIMIDNKYSYFKIEPKDAVYDKDLSSIFEKIFDALPRDGEKYSLFSFIRTLDLMSTYCADSIVESVFEDFVELLWGKEAQRIERDDPKLDEEIKNKMYKAFVIKFPILKAKNKSILVVKKSFYENYKIS
jgi:hypothetical protein